MKHESVARPAAKAMMSIAPPEVIDAIVKTVDNGEAVRVYYEGKPAVTVYSALRQAVARRGFRMRSRRSLEFLEAWAERVITGAAMAGGGVDESIPEDIPIPAPARRRKR